MRDGHIWYIVKLAGTAVQLETGKEAYPMIFANDFKCLTDSATIEKAMENLDDDRMLVISPRKSDVEPERDWWLLDRAILLPENITVIIRNATLKLSDDARDNFFRSANCGFGFPDPERIRNIHIIGEGNALLLGADHPRASGDSSKTIARPCPYLDEDLCKYAYWVSDERKAEGKPSWEDKHDYSYGTDAGKEGESQYGDWRGIGVLLANVENFTVSGLTIKESHGWAISCEACAFGRIEKIKLDATMSKMIDGMLHNMENQDGVDIRNGCHDIIITDITGRTGDDIVALTAIADPNFKEGGSLRTTHVMHNDWSRRDRNIHDIVIRNVVGYSNLCWGVRLLAAESNIWNVVIDGVIDTAPNGLLHGGMVLLGEVDGSYGRNLPDSIKNVTVSNVIAKGEGCIAVCGFVTDSCFTNIISKNTNCPAVNIYRENGLKNTLVSNVLAASGNVMEESFRKV